MYDSDGKSSADIAVSMVQSKKTVEITYTPNAEWLSAEDRVYPVIIDPSLVSSQTTSNIEDVSTEYEISTNYIWESSFFIANNINLQDSYAYSN